MAAPLRIALCLAFATLAGCSMMIGSADDLGSDADAAPALAVTEAPAESFALEGDYHYVYYPEAQVYFAPDRDLYFWRGARYWGVGDRLPSTIELDTTGREIDLDTSKPYRVHEQVVAVFLHEDFSGTEVMDTAVVAEPEAEAPW